MKCSHCLTDFHAETFQGDLGFCHHPKLPGTDFWATYSYQSIVCSKCKGAHIYLTSRRTNGKDAFTRLVYPRGGAFQAAPTEVPEGIAADYREANEVLAISPKASAALSRRCLQAVLSSHGYLGRDLMRQIEAVLSEADASKALPTSLRENIDAIRNFGNFSAHPITDQTTSQIVEVEEGEAEWCLQLLLDMFDHFYVAPARAAERRAALAAKLSAAGKPPMISALSG